MKRLRLILLPAAVILILAALLFKVVTTPIKVPPTAILSQLRCEYLVEPLGLDAVNPRLSWIILSNRRNEHQQAYQILVATSPKWLADDKGNLWDSGRVLTNETSQIAYQGSSLTSREDCYWKVRIWDENGCSAWSPVSHWSMGLLRPADWSAQWISAPAPIQDPAGHLTIRRAIYEANDGQGATNVTDVLIGEVADNRLSLVVNNKTLGADPAFEHHKRLKVDYEWNGQARTTVAREGETLTLPPEIAALPYLRKDFDLKLPVRRATLYATALGLYQVDLNGKRVGDHVFAPDWTDYRKRERYQAYDVTGLLQSGSNVISAMVANGWYSGHIGNGGFQYFGKKPAFLAQLEVEYTDGSTETITSDSSWKSQPGPILSSDFMLGEKYDARREIAGWDAPGLDDSQWTPVRVRHEPKVPLESQVMPPVTELAELKPRKETEIKPGQWIYDLGQNMVGVVRLRVSAPAGTEITLRHAEMLSDDGTMYTNNLRGAPSVDQYTCRGDGVEIWQPRFTFHGFRYVEISGLTADPGTDAVTGIVIGSATPQTGQFACSDPRVNQLESNIQWGQRGNFLSVPTDCPQRDERLGWMGDAEVFIGTACYNADVAAFFTKWLVDVDDGQSSDGAFSDVSPNTMGGNGTPGWGDAGVICPWTIYQAYGDKRILQRHLPAMIHWIEYLRQHSNGLIRDGDRGSDYGDWLSTQADTPKDLIGTAFFAYSTHLVAESCAAVGQTGEAAKYEQLFQDIKAAFIKKYVTADGHVAGGTQTAYDMALKFDLLPADLVPKAAQYLVENVRDKKWHLSTGFLGVGYLLPVLAQTDESDTAYRLLLQDTFPSWLFPVEHGATTIWERWDGWTPDQGFEDPGMNSFNHYSLGSCGAFLYGNVGGIQPASPGYNNILIEPVIGKGLSWARTSYYSIHGLIATYWKVDGNQLTLQVTVPANTTATVAIPAASATSVNEGGKTLDKVDGITFQKQENGRVYVELGSGTYHFTSQIAAL